MIIYSNFREPYKNYRGGFNQMYTGASTSLVTGLKAYRATDRSLPFCILLRTPMFDGRRCAYASFALLFRIYSKPINLIGHLLLHTVGDAGSNRLRRSSAGCWTTCRA